MGSVTNEVLYKVLVKLDYDHRAKFNHEEIDDKEYFRLALEEELISSAIGIVINGRMNNLYSPGVMANCRLIFESLALLNKLDKGQISDGQMRIFRNQHFVVEYNNYKNLLLNPNSTEQEKETLHAQYNEVLDFYVKTLGVRKKDIKSLVRDPLFVLYEKDKGTISPTQLVESAFGKDVLVPYKLFAILEHPFFGLNTDSAIGQMVEVGIAQVIGFVIKHFELSGTFDLNAKGPTISEEIKNSVYQPKIEFIRKKTDYMLSFSNQLSDLGKGDRDNFLWYFMNVMASLYLDIASCVALGYSEQACLKFKPFIEMYAVFYNTQSSADSLAEFNAKKAAYDIGSELSIINLLDSAHAQTYTSRDDELKKAYEDYYQVAYKDDFMTFKKKLIANNLYFLKQEDKNYDGEVEEFMEQMPLNEVTKNTWRSLYKDSKDIGHTGGFLFDCDKGPWECDAPHVIEFINIVFLDLLINANETLIDHGMGKHLENQIQVFKKTIDVENVIFSQPPLSKDDLT